MRCDRAKHDKKAVGKQGSSPLCLSGSCDPTNAVSSVRSAPCVVKIHYDRPWISFEKSADGRGFLVCILPWQYVKFCLKKSMERQKIITFKKKFIKKDLFVEEISYFQEQKSRVFLSKSANISMQNQ